ncbi:MAG: response regulator [Verrucomicrobiae bacterium]|nr:response regulator [Verrucomicrobiae bacterium]
MSIQTTTLTGQSSNPPVENAQQVTRVLVVDDEVGMRALSCAIIKSLGFQAIAVNTGEEAIETYRQHLQRSEPISAVIMDLALPGGMSGLETTDLLRQMDSSVAVIASSGYLQQNARAAALERGFAGILPKPYTPERLTAELRWVITRR